MLLKLPKELVFMSRKNKQKISKETMEGKVVVLSGGTSGVGLEAFKQLAKNKATVILVSRNIEKAERVVKEVTDISPTTTYSYYADFSKLQTVREVANTILENHPKIDVLINSAGIHSTSKKRNEDGFELVFCVNHLAPLLFTELLIERMKDSAPSRIIQVNSEGHRFNGLRLHDLHWKKRIYTGLRGYGASKTAQLMSVWEQADKLKGTNVTINAMHPGAVKSNIGHNNGFLYRMFLRYVMWWFLKDPRVSGDALYYLASSKDLNDVSGKFFNLSIEERPATHALNRTKGRQVYETSLELVGLK